MTWTAGKLAEAIQARVEGDAALEIGGVAAPERAGARDLIYVEAAKHAERAAILAYRSMFPGDQSMTELMRWHALETRHPELFRGMYRVWCRVPA